MRRKSLTLITLLLIPMVPLLSTSCAVKELIECIGKPSIKIFNWGEYIDPATLRSFEKENKICVNYSKFDSVEAAVTKMDLETYDVIFPSDYGIEQLIVEDKIMKLNWDLIDFDIDTELNQSLLELLENNQLYGDGNDFNMLEYAAPYMWGEMGILYDTDVISVEEIEEQGWEAFRNPKYRVAYYDSSRDGFMVPLSQYGYSVNTESEEEINEAKQWLVDQKKTLKNRISYLTDEIIDDMINKRYNLGLVYSGDAIYIMQEQESMAYYRPADKASNAFFDGMVIQKGSKKVELAHKFISYMMSYQASYDNSLYIGYTSAREDVVQELADTEFSDYYDLYNLVTNPMDEIFRYKPRNKELIDKKWAEVRTIK